MIRVRVPATSANLGPGFDCLGMALSIYNTIEMEEAPQGLHLSVAGEGAEVLAGEAGNMVAEAAARLFHAAGRHPRGLRLHVENSYPIARGMGSSAAAIVGGLVAANALLGFPLATDDLLQLAVEMEGHPDNVTPALTGGVTVACTLQEGTGGGGGGARTVYVRFDPPPGLHLAVVIPERPMSTAEARAALPERVPRADAVFNLQRACLLVASLQAGRVDLLGAALDDRLHQPYRACLLPGLADALAAARRPGLLGGCLSGSGSTVLLFLAPGDEARWGEAVDGVAQCFRQQGIACQVRFVRPSAEGAHVVD